MCSAATLPALRVPAPTQALHLDPAMTTTATRRPDSAETHLSEGVAGSPGRDAPSAALIRIAPEQVAHRTLMRHLRDPNYMC